ncbi:MAG TPA: iron ABC transporter permease [Candidatus Acidoferrales bacterium]|nr:iron ABC transporter permease [Candidatus Acidoferrales bacterium]
MEQVFTLDVLSRRGRRSWLSLRRNLIPAAAILFSLWLIIVPLIFLLAFSFRSGTPWNPGAFTLAHYVAAYGRAETYTMLANTAILALASTLLSVAIAVACAFLIERTDMPFRNLAWGLMLVPMAVPGILFAISWVFLLSPRNGLFNVWLRNLLGLFGWSVTEGPLNIYSLAGMVFLEGLRGVTTVFLVVSGAFRAMDPSLEEAARVCGASSRTTFARVFMPLLLPAVLAAGMYSFMSHLESLEIPIVIGFPAGIYVFPTYIYFTTMRFTPPQYGLSAALGISFLVASVFLVAIYRRVAGQAGRFATITGKGYRPRVVHLGKWRYPAFGVFVLYFVLTIAAPALILVWRSLTLFYVQPSWRGLARVTLDNFRRVMENERIVDATLNTLVVAAGTATLTMLLSLTVAWVVTRKAFKGKALLDVLMFLPHALPGVVIAIAFIFLYLQPPLNRLQLYGTLTIIVLALTVSYMAFGTRGMNAAVAQIHTELEEAGQMSGARWPTVMRKIVLPLLMPAFVGGWIWVATHAMRNFSVPLILGGDESKVLSVIMWNLWEVGRAGETTALGVLLIVALTVLTAGGRWIASRLGQRQEE